MRDRVVELRRVPASELLPSPANWRLHPDLQRQALTGVLEDIGMVDAVIARETPDGLQLVDGHLRVDVAGDETIPVLVVDLDDSEADMALATLDPLSAMAEVDAGALRSLVSDLDTPVGGWMHEKLYGVDLSGSPDDVDLEDVAAGEKMCWVTVTVPERYLGELTDLLQRACDDVAGAAVVGESCEMEA